MPSVTVVRTYLELQTPEALRSTACDDRRVILERAPPGATELFRRLYHEVGWAYHWRDRDAVPDDALLAYLESPDVQLWALLHHDEMAGFFELRRHADASVEIVYLGLISRFVGRGLGKCLLSRAAEAAWRMDAARVWLHTCTLDAPSALPNYLARGFEPVRVETYELVLPDPAPSRA